LALLEGTSSTWQPADVFERFNEAARRVVVLAQEEARLLRHNYIGTEHLLLALTHLAEGPVAAALRSAGVDLEEARSEVLGIIGQGTKEPGGHIPFTPRAKHVLELSLSEARRRGRPYIGTEQILWGLLREGEGVGVGVLRSRGVDLEELGREIDELVADTVGGEELFAESAVPAALPMSSGGFVGVARPALTLQGPALVAVVAVLMGVFVASLGEDRSGWVQATMILWSFGIVGLAGALVSAGPVGRGTRRASNWYGMAAVICFVTGSILYVAGTLTT
jgi:hypothetical protein